MISLERNSMRSGEIAYIYKAVPELTEGGIFIEHWYFGGRDQWQGIRVEEDNKLLYAEIIGRGQGIPLGPHHFYGIVEQDKFYDEESFLVNGSILTVCKRRENFGRKESSKFPPIKVSEDLPEKVASILAETEERILKTAELLKLPRENALIKTQ